jgi:hypothetical protein
VTLANRPVTAGLKDDRRGWLHGMMAPLNRKERQDDHDGDQRQEDQAREL